VSYSSQALKWLEIILEERFGVNFLLVEKDSYIQLSIENLDGAVKFVSKNNYLKNSNSESSITYWIPEHEGFVSAIEGPLPAPCVTSLPFPLIEYESKISIKVYYDILGLIYWMLTRQEELGRTDLDSHDRFPATSSHAYKHGYLERPIVDEWLYILGQVVVRVWSGIELKVHKFSIKVSHDVDSPSRYGFSSLKQLARAMAADVIKYRDIPLAIKAPVIRINSKRRLHKADPFNTFDWIMDVSEANGLTSAFYFICGRTDASKDAAYDPEHPAIRHLMQRIHARGHEIGLHPSYNTYKSGAMIAKEAKRLLSICAEEGIRQSHWGGRMHFLRWETPTTLRGWEYAGLSYDSTLSYADHPGFRCGTCFEYPGFDPVKQNMLKIRVRPLIVMEQSIIAAQYLGLGHGDAAFAKFSQLKEACRRVGGCFTLLWHNSRFTLGGERDLYMKILQ
jgi:hypothetical protein